MSASIDSSNQITLTRGDTLILHLSLTENESFFEFEPGDAIRFALKSTVEDDEPLIIKDADMDTRTITIEPEDTKELPFGQYVYDIEYTSEDGVVDTFITPTTFTISEEVY